MQRVTLAAMAFFAMTAPTFGQSPYYLQLDGGASFPTENELADLDLEYDAGFVVGGRLGAHVTEALRLELSAAYTENDIDQLGNFIITDSSVWIFDTSVGAYGDFGITPTLDAYLGGGLGIHYKELDDPTVDDDDTGLTAHGEVGLSFDVSPNFALVPHYRLSWFDDFFEDEQFHHWIRLGLRLRP